MKTKYNSVARRRMRGAAMVEFAFVSILLFTLIFGIIEVGFLIKDKNMITEAARESARALALGDLTTNAVNRGTTTTTLGLTSSNYSLVSYTPSGNTAPPTPPTGWTTITNGTTTNNSNSGDYVCAIVTYAHPLITGYIFGRGTYQLRSVVVERRQ